MSITNTHSSRERHSAVEQGGWEGGSACTNLPAAGQGLRAGRKAQQERKAGRQAGCSAGNAISPPPARRLPTFSTLGGTAAICAEGAGGICARFSSTVVRMRSSDSRVFAFFMLDTAREDRKGRNRIVYYNECLERCQT
jgi:hypothetical protein